MRKRLRVEIRGAVQGVGFRPFVYRLARESGLAGWVVNDVGGVVVEIEGPGGDLDRFHSRLSSEKPAPAVIESMRTSWLDPLGTRGFRIEPSRGRGIKTVQILPDIATCDDCLDEIRNPSDRRKDYPFTNCTHCGPRFTIVRALPYDRSNTTMSGFVMCPSCREEYEEPADRRFHAQPNACPTCGPSIALWNPNGDVEATGRSALEQTVLSLRSGEIVAVKGLGGFHLMADATNDDAVEALRRRKPRREKPLALLLRDLDQLRELCEVDDRAVASIASPQAPILLLPRRDDAPVSRGVAPGNPYLGVMLPCTPLHHLLMDAFGRPLVATSGNLTEEPICIDEREAVGRLGAVADRLLVHDRPIARHADDSIVWIVRDEPRVLRRARGFSPRPVILGRESPTVLAVGAHLKNAVALAVGRQVFVSQHIGDMETPQAVEAFIRVIRDFVELYEATPVALAHDLHPDYVTTRWAREAVRGEAALEGLDLVPVQHHHAHLVSCLAENRADGPALGVIWDGTGYGTDGTVWGGEFLAGDAAGFRRVAHLRPFRLPGGEAAVREPRRSALALIHETLGEAGLSREDLAPLRSFGANERRLLGRMLDGAINAPVTTSAGRLFDAVAALIDLKQQTTFEGQAAMALEHVTDLSVHDAYPLDLVELSSETAGDVPAMQLDWRPLIEAVIEERARGTADATIAARFHNALVDGIVRVATAVDERDVALSGGCFQNRLLVERTARALERAGFRVLLQREVPPNDGGICLGQVVVAAAALLAPGRALPRL